MTPIFVHLPRTAGKVWRKIMNAPFTKDWRFQYVYHNWESNFQAVISDIPVKNQIKAGCPLTIFTMLRDPVDRVVSEWFTFGNMMMMATDFFGTNSYPVNLTGTTVDPVEGVERVMSSEYADLTLTKNGDGQLDRQRHIKLRQVKGDYWGCRRAFGGDKATMWKWMEAYVSHPLTSNTMTKMLLGHGMYDKVEITAADVDTLIQQMKCFPASENKELKECKDVDPIFAGVVDNWNPTLGRVQMILKWKMDFWANAISKQGNFPEDVFFRTYTGRVATEKVPSHIRAKIKEANKLDQKLFDFAKQVNQEFEDEMEAERLKMEAEGKAKVTMGSKDEV